MGDTPVDGGAVQRASGAAGEVGAVEEDAGVLHQAGGELAGLRLEHDVGPRPALGSGLAVELPLLGRQRGRGRLDPAGVLGAGEVGAVGAASLDQLGGRAR